MGAALIPVAIIGLNTFVIPRLFGGMSFNTFSEREVGKQSDLQLQGANMGSPIVHGYGKARVTGNIIWGTKFTEHIRTTTEAATTRSRGGKGGHHRSSSTTTITTTTYSYTVSFAVAICAGPITDITRIWADGVEIKTRDSSVMDYTLYKGDESQMPDPFIEGIEGGGNVPAYRGLAYIVIKNLDIAAFGNRIPALSFEVQFPENHVSNIIRKISQAAGIPGEQVSVEGMNDWTVYGFTVAGNKTFRSQIEALQSGFPFEGFEYDGKIVFHPSGAGDAVAIEAEDLGAAESENNTDNTLTTIRTPEIDLPKTIKLSYISKDRDYQNGTASYTKATSKGVNETSIDTTLILSDGEAAAITERRMKELWANRTTFKFKLPNKYATVQAGTVVTLPYNGRRVNATVTDVSYGIPGISEVTAQLIHKQTYTSVTRKIDDAGADIQAPAPTGIRIEILDIPMIPSIGRSDVVLLSAAAKVYYGANIFRSDDDGVSFTLIKANMPLGVIGDTMGTLGEGTPYTWDEKNSVDVKIFSGTFGGSLESRQEMAVLNGANLCVIGEEMVQFKNAILIAEDTYRLSGLLRGRFGTENHIVGHVPGERFVLINSSVIDYVEASTTDWFMPRLYRYGPSGNDVTDDTYQQKTFTFNAVAAMPLSPCHLEGKRDKAGNVTITWVRRTRGDGGMKSYLDVPLNEAEEKYECCIVKDGQEIRTFTTGSPTATYTAADQTIDFGAVQPSITVRVYQISATRGRGIPREEIV